MMSRFIHVDQSLCSVGGHEYDYAINVLRAAEAAGYAVALAANRRFRDRSLLPSHWPVYPVFPHKAITRHCVVFGGHDYLPMDLDGRRIETTDEGTAAQGMRRLVGNAASVLGHLPRRIDRRHRIRAFSLACKQLFRKIDLSDGDHVFFATFTEFDLLGLTRYLASDERSQVAAWHLQFHWDFLTGCEPNRADQEKRRLAVRRQFRHALRHLPDHKVLFYNTTVQLAAQYNSLGVRPFKLMPHAVNPSLESSSEPQGNPLRVTCPGGMRHGKGFRKLAATLKALRAERFFDKKIEVVAQLSRRKSRRLAVLAAETDEDKAEVRLLTLPHPLSTDAYFSLIRQTDVGLFLHDRRPYQAMCSAVLEEVLAAGKPVIVPAGCWLAEQIAEPTFRHVQTMRQILPPVRRLRTGDIPWQSTDGSATTCMSPAGNLSFTDSMAAETDVKVPRSATECVVAFRWARCVEFGNYIRVQTEQLDCAGNQIGRFDSIVGQRRDNMSVQTLIHLNPRAVRIVLRLQNAYHPRPLAVADVEIDFLDARRTGGCPAGVVGLVAAQPAQVPELLREIVERYSHYRESAETFSHCWREAREPARTIEILMANRMNQPDAAVRGRAA